MPSMNTSCFVSKFQKFVRGAKPVSTTPAPAPPVVCAFRAMEICTVPAAKADAPRAGLDAPAFTDAPHHSTVPVVHQFAFELVPLVRGVGMQKGAWSPEVFTEEEIADMAEAMAAMRA